MSKILKITMILVMTFFAVFITPQERASANPLAVGGALYLGGAGIYVVGVLGIAAVAGLVELDSCSSCQDDLEAHAARVWEGSTQVVKDGMQLMVDSAIGVGEGMTALDANVNTWLQSQIDGITGAALNSSYGTMTAATAKLGCNCSNYDRKWINQSNLLYGFYAPNGAMYQELFISTNTSTITLNFHYSVKNGVRDTVPNFTSTVPLLAGDKDKIGAIQTATQAIAFANLKGLSAPYGLTANLAAAATAIKARVTETWEEMQDAGLVLPVDSARLVDSYGPVTYDPTTDSYAGIDGVNVPRENITAEYPKVKYKTEQDLLNAGAAAGAAAGLYIDGWTSTDSTTSTYDPATDITTSTTSSTTTSTNVTTGETVTSATSTTTTATGDTTSTNNPTPEGETPKTQSGKANRWGKLVTTKFPFSLPWDLFFILSFMNADPVSPVFEVDERILKRENVEGIQIKFAIDLSFLDPYVPWFRRFLVLGFAFFLVMNTRKLLGGAQ